MVVGGTQTGSGECNTPDTLSFGSLSQVDPRMFADDAELTIVSAGATVRGRAAIATALHQLFHISFSQIHEEPWVCLADDEHAACEWLFCGAHTGWLDGIAATQRHVALSMTAFFDFDAGRIRSARLYYDTAALMRQLGYG